MHYTRNTSLVFHFTPKILHVYSYPPNQGELDHYPSAQQPYNISHKPPCNLHNGSLPPFYNNQLHPYEGDGRFQWQFAVHVHVVQPIEDISLDLVHVQAKNGKLYGNCWGLKHLKTKQSVNRIMRVYTYTQVCGTKGEK